MAKTLALAVRLYTQKPPNNCLQADVATAACLRRFVQFWRVSPAGFRATAATRLKRTVEPAEKVLKVL